jgi:hypothetical protein
VDNRRSTPVSARVRNDGATAKTSPCMSGCSTCDGWKLRCPTRHITSTAVDESHQLFKSTTPTSLALKGSRGGAAATHYPCVGAAMGHHRGFNTATQHIAANHWQILSTTAENLPNPPSQRRGALLARIIRRARNFTRGASDLRSRTLLLAVSRPYST